MARYEISAKADMGFDLILNMMRDRTESRTLVQSFDTLEELQAFYRAEKVPFYTDQNTNGFSGEPQSFNKCFRKGGPLEWFNPSDEAVERGILDQWGHGATEFIRNVSDIRRVHRIG